MALRLPYERPRASHAGVEAQGQTLSTAYTPTLSPPVGCGWTSDEVELELEGDGCPAPTGSALEGSLIDAYGDEVEGSVVVSLLDQTVPCEVDGARFRCPALSPYSAVYSLVARFGSSEVRRSVMVEAAECELERVDATIDLRESECEKTEQVVQAYVFPPRGTELEVFVLGARGEELPCQVYVDRSDKRWRSFSCPSISPTGGGHYAIVLRAGSQQRTLEVDVQDDGCNAFRPQVPDVVF